MRVHTQKGMKDNYMIFAMRAADEQRAAVVFVPFLGDFLSIFGT